MEAYRETVRKLNELNLVLQRSIKRCQDLKQRGDANKPINPEQSEAYYQRVNWYKPKICRLLEEIGKLEDKLKTMPREWIV